MKSVTEVLGKLKGPENVDKIVTGKGSYSTSALGDVVSALANDTTFKFKSRDKSGKTVETNISELLRADVKKSVACAKYPQKSEVDVIDSSEISTAGLTKAISAIISVYLQTGKKFSLPPNDKFVGDIYLAPVAGKTKNVNVRDIKTGAGIGTSTVVSKDSVQVRTRSPVPSWLQTKTRKDINGNVIQ